MKGSLGLERFAVILGPTLGKLILSAMFGPQIGGMGGSLISVAANRFKDQKEARRAAKRIEDIGAQIAEDMQAAIKGEGATDEEIETVANELDLLLRNISLASILVDASLNEGQISQQLRQLKKPAGLNEREIEYINFALSIGSKKLRILAPTLSGYSLERDEVILTTLDALSKNYQTIKSDTSKLNDVCEKVLSELGGIKTKEEREILQFETNYLRHIENLLNYVEILGLDNIPYTKQNAELSVAYLSLSLFHGEDETTSFDFTQLIPKLRNSSVRMVIEGGAGSGKSTLLRWAALNLNDESLTSQWQDSFNWAKSSIKESLFRRYHNLHQRRYRRLPSIDKNIVTRKIDKNFLIDFSEAKTFFTKSINLANEAISQQKFNHTIFNKYIKKYPEILNYSNTRTNYIPILIRLRELEDGLPGISSFHQLISPTVSNCPSGWLEHHLHAGTVLVMFDGVDEVPLGDPRDKILAQISEFARQFPECSILVTSRPGAFSHRNSRIGNFEHATIDDLDYTQQQQFVRNWHSAWSKKCEIPETEATKKQEKLLRKLDEDNHLKRLATNPLICASICALHEHDEENLPRDERGLCEGLTKMLVERRDKSQGIAHPPIDLARFSSAYQISFEKKKVILAKIAAEMLRSGESTLSLEDLLRVLPNSISSIGKETDEIPEICAALVERSGVLRGCSPKNSANSDINLGQYNLPEGVEFLHNRFKEWLASTFFLSEGTPNELVKRADEEGFAEVCVFAAAAPDQATFSKQLVKGILSRVETEKSRILKRKLRVLAVRCSNSAPSLNAELRKTIDKLSSGLLPPKTLEEAHALAELGDYAVQKLAPNEKIRKASDLIPTIRCLSLIDTENAKKVLREYRDDNRWTVVDELSKSINPIEMQLFIKSITNKTKISNISMKIRRRCKEIPKSFYAKIKDHILDLRGTEIRSIKGISAAQSLRKVSLDETFVTDFRELSQLENLEDLSLSGCQIEDEDNIKYFSKLYYLDISGSKLISIDGISSAKRLKILVIDSSAVEDISDLEKVESLILLSMCDCVSVSNWKHLKSLRNISYLNLSGSNFDSLRLLPENKEIKELYLSETLIDDYDLISELRSLEGLSLHGTSVNSADSISGLTNLMNLDFGRTGLHDLRPLEQLTEIRSLGLHQTEVSDLSVLENMKNLERLYIGHTKVTSLEPLRNLKNLNHLVVSGLEISDFEPIKHLRNLTILN